jgi:hypothetical protein
MRTYTIHVVILTSMLTASAGGAEQATPPSSTQATVKAPSAVTIEGCLRSEDQVPGRTPSALDRAGILEDYLLTDAKVVRGSVPVSATTQVNSDVFYRVIGIRDQQLKKLVGKRVQVQGTMAGLEQGMRVSTDPAGSGENLPQISGKSIRPVAGSCSSR